MLYLDRIGDEFLLAFDESQAMLALISCEKVCSVGDPKVGLKLKTPQATVTRFCS